MKPEELTGAFESLQKLEHHYKNQYEEYIAKAMSAKANLDRLEVLLKDLSSQLPLYPQEQSSFLEFEPDEKTINGSREQLELDWMGALIDDETEPDPEPDQSDDKTETQEISHRELVKLSFQVMPILESIFALDVGKKLHLSYLHKAVNQKSLLGLSQDTVELFLEEAIAIGYCERDNYDKHCYYSVSEPKTLLQEALRNNPYKRTFEKKAKDEEVKEKQQQNQEDSVTLTEANFNHNLPFSPRVKMTIPDTIIGYIIECQPKTFKAGDVFNYLYSDSQQASWSKAQKNLVKTSITNGLYRYDDKPWKRVNPGVYQPLLPIEVKYLGSLTQNKPNHNLPPSPKVKMNMLDTILGYIHSCQPKTFKAGDVFNYLYSNAIQKQWTESQRDKYFSAIANGLHYYWKQNKWKRIKMGVYRPLNNQ